MQGRHGLDSSPECRVCHKVQARLNNESVKESDEIFRNGKIE